MKKILFVFIITIFIIQGSCFGVEEVFEEVSKGFKISEFTKEAKSYTEENFPEFNLDSFIKNSIKGEMSIGFFKKAIIRIFSEELLSGIRLMTTVLTLIIVCSISKSIIENLGDTGTTKIVYYIQYVIIATVLINSFLEILHLTQDTIIKLTNFMNLLVPLFTTLVLTTGNIATTNMFQPILLFIINFITNFTNNFLIPILLVSMSFTITSSILEKGQLEGISKFLRSSIVWLLGIILTIFTSILSLEGTLSSSVDGFTSKTTKAAISNFIPIFGKILGDSLDSVLGCSNILKNTVGILGTIIIVIIVLIPIIKIAVYCVCFKITALLGETLADTRSLKLISGLADGYKVLLGILCSISIMFIIGITIVLKITNSSIMYR